MPIQPSTTQRSCLSGVRRRLSQPGWTFGAALFGSLLGFAIIKPLSRIAPKFLGGGYFGPKENVTVQTAATAAGGLGIIFVGPVPAMYQMGLMSKNPQDGMAPN